MNLKKYDFRKIALIADVIIILIFIVGVLITPDVNYKNTTLVSGHYDGVETEVVKGDTSYNLFIKERADYYKISADNSSCFEFDGIKSRVKKGEAIQIYLSKPIAFFSIRGPSVVAIKTEGGDYLSFDCVNNENRNDKIKMPLLLIAVGLAVAALIYKKEIKLLVK